MESKIGTDRIRYVVIGEKIRVEIIAEEELPWMVIVSNEAIKCVSKEGIIFFKLKSCKTRGRKAEQIVDS